MKASIAIMLTSGLLFACSENAVVPDVTSAIQVAMTSVVAPVPTEGLDWHAKERDGHWDVWFGPDYLESQVLLVSDRRMQRYCEIEKRSGYAECRINLLLQ